jgi:hypothetical protein
MQERVDDNASYFCIWHGYARYIALAAADVLNRHDVIADLLTHILGGWNAALLIEPEWFAVEPCFEDTTTARD